MILKPFNAEKIKLAKTDSEKKGYENEKQVAYLLDFHYKDSETTAILHDIRFTYNGRTAQIDHLIITHGFLFVIESKMYSGVLEINSNSWTVDYGKVRHSIPSPVKQ
ncbi:MAG: nuclease-related domain-containing protein, partial [Sulfurimonas sp.]